MKMWPVSVVSETTQLTSGLQTSVAPGWNGVITGNVRQNLFFTKTSSSSFTPLNFRNVWCYASSISTSKAVEAGSYAVLLDMTIEEQTATRLKIHGSPYAAAFAAISLDKAEYRSSCWSVNLHYSRMKAGYGCLYTHQCYAWWRNEWCLGRAVLSCCILFENTV